MEPLVLTSKNQFPSRDVIAAHVGKRMALWDALFEQFTPSTPTSRSGGATTTTGRAGS